MKIKIAVGLFVFLSLSGVVGAMQPKQQGTMVKLKNGSYVPRVMVNKIMGDLRRLANQSFEALALVELVRACQNPEYHISSKPVNFLSVLCSHGLTSERGTPKHYVPAIVLSAVRMNQDNVVLESPFADDEKGGK
jgi:hypothetical protein